MDMGLSPEIVDVLKTLGVGRRSPDDDFLKDNKILASMKSRLGVYDIDDEELCHPLVNIRCHVPGCMVCFTTVMDFDSHYNSVHRYRCCECRKDLPSAHLLELHIAETHDSFFAAMAERGPAFSCYLEECKTKFLTPDERKDHCITVHKFPADFRYGVIKTKKNKKNKLPRNKKQQKNEQPSNTVNESDEMSVDQNVLNPPKDSNSELKPKIKEFSFGHVKNKGFMKSSTYTGKIFTTDNKEAGTSQPSQLESENMLVDLMESLPE